MSEQPIFRKGYLDYQTAEARGWQYPLFNKSSYYVVSSPSKEDPSVHRYAMVAVEHASPQEANFTDGAETLWEDRGRTPELYKAYSDPSMRIHVPTLLSLAHKEHGFLTLPDSLSRHSSKLAKKAVHLGVAKSSLGNKEMAVRNKEDFKPLLKDINTLENHYPIVFSDMEVLSAKQHLRHILGRDKPIRRHMGPQFSQDRLPEVDW